MRADVTEISPTTDAEHRTKRNHTKSNTVHIPKGLIGAKSTAQVCIEGKTCNCLLDTGSQVTTISQSFYEQNLSNLKVHSLNNLLEVEAANGQTVPYLGYIEADITFPKDFLGTEIEVSTLALIVPDMRANAQSTLLIGTNALDLV